MPLADLQTSCATFDTFPENLIDPGPCHRYMLLSLQRILAEKSTNLFCQDGHAQLEIYRHDAARNSFASGRFSSLSTLRRATPCDQNLLNTFQACQFIFLGAFSGRDKLYVSQEMLLWLLSILQVMPEVLEFLLPFGKQLYADDFQFSSFRQESRLNKAFERAKIDEIGRSGRHFQLCYNLKAVESKPAQQAWPWSMRQTAIWHSFDIAKIQTSWIVVKANSVVRDRLAEVTATALAKDLHIYSDMVKTFQNSLICHLVVVDWCAENWRWYINFFEKRLEHTTARAILSDVTTVATEVQIASTGVPQQVPVQPRHLGARTWIYRNLMPVSTTSHQPPGATSVQMHNLTSQAPLAGPGVAALEYPDPPELPPDMDEDGTSSSKDDLQDKAFKIDELQNAQFLESHASENILILKSNITIITHIWTYYEDLVKSPDLDQLFKGQTTAAVQSFGARLKRVKADLQGHLERMEALMKLAADRKNMVYNLVEYQNMQQSKRLANEAARSAERMEEMTEKMQALTRKTSVETVLMRIITLVTVFFLPGTFVSTLMSANIIEFKASDSSISAGTTSLGAIKFFLCLSLTLMFGTFVVGGGMFALAVRYDGR